MVHAFRIRRLIGILVLALATLCPSGVAAENWSGRVVGVHDGDTITVLVDQRQVKVRVLGIDAPELGQSHGAQARQAMAALVLGETVTVEVVDTDRYHRKVARVFVGGCDAGAALVRDGHAWWFQRYAPDYDELRDGETDARRQRRGLWRDDAPTAPWDWRRAMAAARVAARGR